MDWLALRCVCRIVKRREKQMHFLTTREDAPARFPVEYVRF
jgi:hypothetical protein